MSLFQRCVLGMAVLAEGAGMLFVGASVYFAIMLTVDTANPLRHEYGAGIGLGLIYGFCGLLVATFLAIPLKRVIPQRLFAALTIPALVVGITILGLLFYATATQLVG